MPAWFLVLISFMTVSVIAMGAISFTIVPMFFGVYGTESDNFRGKLIVKLLWMFPLVSIACLYIAWTSNSFFSLGPVAYFALVWSLRMNKRANSGVGKQFTTKQENLADSLLYLEKNWDRWQALQSGKKPPTKSSVDFNFFASSTENAALLKDVLVKTEKLHRDIEISPQPNGGFDISVGITLDAIDKNSVTTLITRMVDKAWDNNCELWLLILRGGVENNT